MASGGVQPSGPPGQRHSGVVHGGLSRRPCPDSRAVTGCWPGLVAGLTVITLVIVANVFAGRPPTVADDSDRFTQPQSSFVTPGLRPGHANTVAATDAIAFTQPDPSADADSPSDSDADAHSPSDSNALGFADADSTDDNGAPTLAPPPTPPTATPTQAPSESCASSSPADGSTTSDHSIVISRLRAAECQRSRTTFRLGSMNTPQPTTEGRWSFTEQLAIRARTRSEFRVADDRSTEIAITVYHAPV